MGNSESQLRVNKADEPTSEESQNFNAEERERLDIAIKNINTKFPFGTVSTETLKQVFPMPTPTAVEFCRSLDTMNAEIIDFEPMFFWLRRYCSGNIIDKAEMLFRMFGDHDELTPQGKKNLFLVLNALSTPIHLYFNVVGEQANMCPQLTDNQKTFITEILQRVFQEKQIQVSADGTFEPQAFLNWMPKYINRFENSLILANQEIKRPAKQSSNKEVVRMEKLLKHFNRLFPHKTLSFETFWTRFPMPGEFGHRFCSYFDESNSEIIDFAPLTGWLHNYAQADVAQKFKLLFLIYGDGNLVTIKEQEMVDVLSVLLMPFTKFFPLHHEPNKEAQMPILGSDESELLELVLESFGSEGDIDTAAFVNWIQRNKDMVNQIAGQLGMIPVKRKVQIAPIDSVFWSPEAPEIVAGESVRMKLQCNPQVKGGNIRLTFVIPENYKNFVTFTPPSVVIPQNSDLSEEFELYVHDACPIMPPGIDAIAEAIEGKPNLEDELTEFPLDYIEIVEPTSTLPQMLIDFLRLQFDFATGIERNYFDKERLAHFMLLGHPGTPEVKLGKGVDVLMKRFGTDDQLYWRGFLKSYEQSYSNKKQMQQEMSLRGLTDSVDTTLPLELYYFLLYNFQSFTIRTNNVFTLESLQQFMEVGYPETKSEILAKGTQTALEKYGNEEEGEQILAWQGFLQMYETTYAKNKKSLKKEFEKRGFTLHKLKEKQRPRLPSRGSMSNLIPTEPSAPKIKRQPSQPKKRQSSIGRFETAEEQAPPKQVATPVTPPKKTQPKPKQIEEERSETPPPPNPESCCTIS